MVDRDAERHFSSDPEAGRGERSHPDAARPAPASGQQAAKPADAPKTAGDLLPAVSLPKGGGAIRGLGDKLDVDAATGTATMALPLPFTPGRSGFTPALKLAYDSGAGNGPFGFGWRMDAPAITRKTDKGLPRYCDDDESDVFILSGAEDLVPILSANGSRKTTTRTVYATPYRISWYRPRVEGLFARVERWVATDSGISHWRSISRDNLTTLYGYDETSRVADPHDATRVFSWHICRSWDDKGNVAVYSYRREDSAGIDLSQAHEANRTVATRKVQTYLTTIQYGNLAPFFPDWSAATEPALSDKWMFTAALDYGDHAASPPGPQADATWPVRPDPFSTYRPGFEVRTYRRVQRLLFFNDFPQEASAGPDCLVRSLDLAYSDQQNSADPRNPIYTLLVAVSERGYRKEGGGILSRALPSLEFAYSQPQIQSAVRGLDRDSLGNLPEGIDGSRFRWVDLDGEGLSGILTESPGGWYYKRNLSANNRMAQPDGSVVTQASFGPLETVAALPSHAELAGQQLLNLSGSGRLDVVELAPPDAGFYKRTSDENFEPFRPFASLPQLDWADPNLKFIDLTGDGLADILITEGGLFTFHASLGDAGFDVARLVRTPWDEEKGPKIVLADGTDMIFLADLSGDGLNDVVRVRNGECCYWPNIGYGRFGAKVTMDFAPRFDNEERFDPRRLRLADLDGTGSADLLYIGGDGVRAWFNRSGNAWSQATTVGVFPAADRISSVQALDLLGTGTACLVWSSPLPAAATPLLYVDLMGGVKPHLLVLARNNLGAETRLSYAPSTQFYLADREAGRPWITRLPFPVQVVERVETIDWVGRNRLVTRYAYHHGYFDGYEREFRGFGLVEQWDTEEFRGDTAFNDGEFVNWEQQSWSPPMRTRTWFHTGAFSEALAVTGQYRSEYWVEPALRSPNRAADAAAMQLPETVIPGGLDAFEIQEAYRALKGHQLRVEIYAEDGTPGAGNPYTLTEQNFTVRCLQHRGGNPHAVFLVHPRETVSFHYERAAEDPRVAHDFTLEVDDYGNVSRSMAVAYPRRGGFAPPEPTLSAATQAMLAYDQGRLHLQASEQQHTFAIDDTAAQPDVYRAPLPAAGNVAEITGVAPSAKGNGITDLFSFEELNGTPGSQGIWQFAWSGNHDIPYEAVPAADIDGSGAPAAGLTRRLIGQHRVLYRSDDLNVLLPPRQLQSRALPGETYQAALTSGLLSGIFGPLVSAATLTEGGYIQLAGETGWWMPSGRVFYSPGDGDTPAQELAVALAQLFLPRRAIDPLGGVTRVDYDGYALLPVAITDPVGNVVAAANDYRVARPATVTDANGNRTSIAFDTLGFVTATAVAGKTGEPMGDLLSGFAIDLNEAAIVGQFADPLSGSAALLGNATTRILYDINAYARTKGAAQPSPPAVYTLARETHVADLGAAGAPAATQYQYAFAYSDGFGREIQRKARVAPGPAPAGSPPPPRWAGSGWTIFDNKGRPVRRYEPFFSATHQFEFAAQAGVATVLFYDPAGRGVATLHPDNSWEKVVFDAWRQETWDGNDTVRIDDPRTDADVGDHFKRALGADAFTSWFALRIGGNFGANAEEQAAQQDAAQKAAAHAATQTVTHFDTLGRACLAVGDNGGGNRFPSRTAFDTQGKPLAIFDSLGRRAQEYCFRAPQPSGFQYLAGTDMAGNPLYRINSDAGARRTLGNVAGHPIRSWDDRGHAFRLVYDRAQRLVERHVGTNGGGEVLLEFLVYGEGQAAANLSGRLFRHYDMAGYVENSRYDFKGNLVASTRQLALAYRQAIDWKPLLGLTDAAQLDAAATAAALLPTSDGMRDRFLSGTVYDALNRPIQVVAPHNATMKPGVLRPGYDEGGRVARVDAWLQQAAAPATLLDPASADRHAVADIEYNPRGQRLSVVLGNGSASAYAYDAETFRLTRCMTTRPNSFPADQQTVQALLYFYDPVGNVTRIRDDADIQGVIFFRNGRVEPSADYTYDPLYRLLAATGREHLGQTGGALQPPQQVSNDDTARMGLPQPGDSQAMATYTERYSYDPVDNILSVVHQVSSGGWTRRYAYVEPSRIAAGESGNRLTATSLPGDPASGPFSATYGYDPHGNMLHMPHLPAMAWDEDDRLRSSTRQVVNAGTPETSYYVYNAGGQRVRKVTDRQAAGGQQPTRRGERIYLGIVELYREYAADGTTVSLERETLHVDAVDHPVALIETRTTGNDPSPPQLVRYQYANHLGSAELELGDQCDIISYEEYFPFGSTAYQAVASQTDVAKRYRHAGKERDTENDLYYHGARYCAPWLGRWTACDPAGVGDGLNLYAYVRNNPIRLTDPHGTQSADTNATKPSDAKSSSGDAAQPLSPEMTQWVKDVAVARDQVLHDIETLQELQTPTKSPLLERIRHDLVGDFQQRLGQHSEKYAELLNNPPASPPAPQEGKAEPKANQPGKADDKPAQPDATQPPPVLAAADDKSKEPAWSWKPGGYIQASDAAQFGPGSSNKGSESFAGAAQVKGLQLHTGPVYYLRSPTVGVAIGESTTYASGKSPSASVSIQEQASIYAIRLEANPESDQASIFGLQAFGAFKQRLTSGTTNPLAVDVGANLVFQQYFLGKHVSVLGTATLGHEQASKSGVYGGFGSAIRVSF